ncbi:MAG: ATP-dependent DNA ligase [Armatimonadota bacterium]|nr:ATP-dependent DNA ligase [Armatimonadota bacterium]MDR7472619.1 ATP-dependent DNA ligase [Armatimonadota bacterium]MDR7510095.1 ATP-dependent DNA ligase [Armatimonadota bacterium]MDR7583495.1 ATP-dependent DNA ligase [Armatimonadota bacterium]
MRRLAAVLDAVAGTASTLRKVEILADYLRSLSEEALRIACTFLTGSPLPPASGRTLQVGWSTLVEALQDVTGAPPEAVEDSYLRHGDLGSVAAELLTRKARGSLFGQPLTLARVAEAFSRLAETAGPRSRQAKGEGIRALLQDAEPAEARYLVRIITSDMRVGLKEGLLEEAIARAFGAPLDAVRRAHMLTGDIGQVAVLARAGRLGEARLQLFRPLRFMLADTMYAADEAFAARGAGGAGAPEVLMVEDKYDGIRCQVHSDGSRIAIYSRTLDEVTASFPELHADLRSLAGRYVLDGEIVAWKDGPLPFVRLQQRLRRKDPDAVREEVPVVLWAFDLLHLDGADLVDLPLRERRRLLQSLRWGEAVRLAASAPVATAADLAARFRQAREAGYEGVVVKRPDSPYLPGRRGRLWLKWKEELATLDVVVVAAEQGNGKRAGVLSDVTFAVRDGDRLVPVGKAYTGLTDAEIAELTAWFRAHTLQDRGRVKVVEPKVVLEVAFDAVTRSPRHPGGYALRFPRITRIRYDKTAEEISTLDDVRAIFERQGAARGGVSARLPAAGRVR